MFGCYEALDGGELAEALADFTGGVSEIMDLTSGSFVTDEAQRDTFYDWLSRAVDNNSLMCAAITVSVQKRCSFSSSEQPTTFKHSNVLLKTHFFDLLN